MSPTESTIYEFGSYQLNTGERVLFRAGELVPLQWKALETLSVLVRSEGRIVSREELIEAIWPDAFVEENNLSQQIRALRKALGNGEEGTAYIETVPRRGYRFVPSVTVVSPPAGDSGSAPPLIAEAIPAVQLPEAEEPAPQPSLTAETVVTAPVPPTAATHGRRFSRNAVVLILVSICIVSVGGFIGWKNRPRTTSNKIWKSAGASQRAIFDAAAVQRIPGTSDAVISNDGKRVAFVSKAGGKFGLSLYQVASGRVITISPPNGTRFGKLRFSDDDEFIYFAALGTNDFTLYKIPVLGGDAVPLVERIGGHFSFSPNMQNVAAVRMDREKGLCSLVTISLADRSETVLGTKPSARCYDEVAWSPNGRFIAASIGTSDTGEASNEVIEVSIDGREERHLTSEKWENIRDMIWVDHGGLLLSGRKNGPTDYTQLWLVRRSTGEARQISNDTTNYTSLSLTKDTGTLLSVKTGLNSELFTAPSDAPDQAAPLVEASGRISWPSADRILYTPYKQKMLWALNPDTSEQVQIGNSHDTQITASADREHIYSVSAESGRFHIWRMNSDGSQRVQLTKGSLAEQYPEISPDGRWIYYESISPEGPSVWRIHADGSGSPVRIHGSASRRPSVSPDGRLLAYFFKLDRSDPGWKIAVYSTESHARVAVLDPANPIINYRIAWDADAKAIYYTAESADRTVNIWHHPLDGTPPQQITNFSDGNIYDFVFSPDRTRIAFVRGKWVSEAEIRSFAE